MTTRYQIVVYPEGNKFLAKVSKQIGFNLREGSLYEIIAVALGENEADTIYEAVNEAFYPS